VSRVYFVSETAQVELRSGRLYKDPAVDGVESAEVIDGLQAGYEAVQHQHGRAAHRPPPRLALYTPQERKSGETTDKWSGCENVRTNGRLEKVGYMEMFSSIVNATQIDCYTVVTSLGGGAFHTLYSHRRCIVSYDSQI